MPRRIISFLLLIQLLFGISLYAEVVDKIIVIVNDEIITQGEVDRILSPMYQQWKMAHTDEELAKKIDEARFKVLQRLINDKLLFSEAKRTEIEVTDEDVQLRIEEVKKRFANEEEFKMNLLRENITLGELEKKYKERIMIDKLINTEIRGRISVAPSEVTEYYRTHKDEFREPKKVKVRSILIRVDERRPAEKALEKSKEILARLEEGGDFSLLAKEYSEGPYRDKGGDMGWVKENELMTRINDVLFKLDKDEMSGIVKTNLGFHIFRIDDVSASRVMKFHESKNLVERHIFNKKMDEKLGQWLEKLREDAYIAFK